MRSRRPHAGQSWANIASPGANRNQPAYRDWRCVIAAQFTGVFMSIAMTRLILYVRDVTALKSFYQTCFGFDVLEEIEGEWVVLKAGPVELALHLVGRPYRDRPLAPGSGNAKLVFSMPSGMAALREQLLRAGVQMSAPKRYDGFAYTMCDGQDPEGNVFQLSQSDPDNLGA